jgi:hypothetical protein
MNDPICKVTISSDIYTQFGGFKLCRVATINQWVIYVSVQEYRQVVIGTDVMRKGLTSEREQSRKAKNRDLARILQNCE